MEFLFASLRPRNDHMLFWNNYNENFCFLSKYVLLCMLIHTAKQL